MGEREIARDVVFMTEDGEIIGFQNNAIVDAPDMTLANDNTPNIEIPEKWDFSATLSGTINWTAFGKYVLPKILRKHKKCNTQTRKCLHRAFYGKTWKIRKKNAARYVKLLFKAIKRWGGYEGRR